MDKAEAVAFVRGEIRRAVRDLEAVRDGLEELAERLPLSEEETDPEKDLTTLDEASGLRTALHCVLRDRIVPAIKDLQAALEPREDAGEVAG